MIYCIATKENWEIAQKAGLFRSGDLEKEGFIRCCAADQIELVARRYFPGHSNLMLLEVDESLVEADVRWENREGGEAFYPNVYGPIPLSAVGQVSPFRT